MLLLGMCLLFSHCVQTQMGAMMEQPVKHHRILTTSTEDEFPVYQLGPNQYLVQLKEQICEEKQELIIFTGRKIFDEQQYQETGKSYWVKLSYSTRADTGAAYVSDHEVMQEEPDLGNLRPLKAGRRALPSQDWYSSESLDEPSIGRMMAAAPVKYVIDPAVSIVATTASYSAVVICAPFAYLFSLFDSPSSEESLP